MLDWLFLPQGFASCRRKEVHLNRESFLNTELLIRVQKILDTTATLSDQSLHILKVSKRLDDLRKIG